MSQTDKGDKQILADERPPCLSVVMPVYNEEATILDVVSRVLAVPYLLELIIVDDCSTDSSPSLARQLSEQDPRVRVVFHDAQLRQDCGA